MNRLNDDFADMLRALQDAEADFLVVGAHALAVHGVVRATGDLDILVRPSPDNAQRVIAALEAFGAPLQTHGVSAKDFSAAGNVYQLGLPPQRIDLMTEISGVTFEDAWSSRLTVEIEDLEIPFLGREALVRNKQASGRDKDILDAERLLSDQDSDSC